MTEAFLHHVWQFQYFNKSDLQTTDGDIVSVYHTGARNLHAGPDFFNAKIRIGDMEWIGNVEIHIHASEWFDHKHDRDDAYDNVILHVVWKADKKITRKDGTQLPTIELKGRVHDNLLLHYKRLINNPEKIPCASSLNRVPELTRLSMFDKALMQRLETKALHVNNILKKNNNDWDETTYQMLCRNFGFKVNAEPFEQLAHLLPYKILLKHADRLEQAEAMLFGQAGFLNEKGNDEYFSILKREYAILGKKYNLSENRLSKAQWKFLRLRPANFPTLRLAQLAALICQEKNIFSRLIEAYSYEMLQVIFSAKQSPYWQRHYQFFKAQDEEIAPIGSMSIDNIIINTVVPLLVAYGKTKDEQIYIDRAVEILQHITTEDNTILKSWKQLGVKSNSAADSQALIELHNNFCLKRRCLDCNIGFYVIQPALA